MIKEMKRLVKAINEAEPKVGSKLEKIINLLKEGKTVYFSTIYKVTKVTKKHIPLLSSKIEADGEHIYIKGIDYTYTKITYTN